jgi:dolichol-phosphate mannosyltransferase
MSEPLLSIVSPVYRSAPIVAPLVEGIVAAASRETADFEIILVEDCGPDDSWACIVAAAAREPRVRGLRLSRNFGQHAAITAGLAHARGRYVVVMDCDLQDDPAYIPALLAKAREGFDVVLTRKDNRQHAAHRNLGARLFSTLFNALSGHRPADPHVGGYSLLTRKVVDAFLRIQDVQRHYLLILGWMGFRTGLVNVEHRPRHTGESSYAWIRLVRHAVAGLTSQSTLVLKLSIGLGFGYCAAALAGTAYLCVGFLTHGYLAGWASTVVLLLASTGLILLAIGVLGLYIGNIFEQVRGRPLYLVQDHVNLPAAPS